MHAAVARGRSAAVARRIPASQSLRIRRFGKIYEATPSGNKVNSHSITSLASETAAFTHGAPQAAVVRRR